MQRFSGHLQEVVAYKNQTTWGPFQEEFPRYFLEENYYYCMQFLSYLGVVPCCH